MKIKIKLNIELREGVCEGLWGVSILDWQDCWLKTKYEKGKDHSFVAYLYPTVWEYYEPNKDVFKDGFMRCATFLNHLDLREWLKECEEYLKDKHSLLLV